jgi:FixJ family two-component response regulator
VLDVLASPRVSMTRNGTLIAIVDDDASVCRALERLVRSFGYVAETFSCGEDFLNELDRSPSFRPCCVVLDMHMPGLTGLDVQQRLAHTALPVIFITAHDQPGLREKVLSAGAVALLRKPFTDDVFLGTLHAATSTQS